MTKMVDVKSLNAFKTDGVAILRNIISDWVETLRAGIASNLAHPGLSRRSYQGDCGDGEFHSDYCSWPRVSEYKDLILTPPLGKLHPN